MADPEICHRLERAAGGPVAGAAAQGSSAYFLNGSGRIKSRPEIEFGTS